MSPKSSSKEAPVFNVWSSDNENYSNYYYYKNWKINRDLFMKYNKSTQVVENEFAPLLTRTPPRSREASRDVSREVSREASREKTPARDVSPSKSQIDQQQQQQQQQYVSPRAPLYVVTPPPVVQLEPYSASVPMTPRSAITPKSVVMSSPLSQSSPAPHLRTVLTSISAACTDTDEDFFAYLRANRYPTSQLDLPHSIELAYTKSGSCSSEHDHRRGTTSAGGVSSSSRSIRYRKLAEGVRRNSDLKQIVMKQYECPLSGAQRSTLVMPFESGYDLLNGGLEKKPGVLETYEEYLVSEAAVDTRDIENYLDLEPFTSGQLFSNKASLEYITMPRGKIFCLY
jgi:hypothetical protein